MDEVRVSDKARSSGWIATSYNNQNNPPQFYTKGFQQQVSFKISGTVFQDIIGDGLNDGDTNLNDGSGDQRAGYNTRVLLFKDNGDGIPGSGDSFITADTTGFTGRYVFTQPQGTYWVAVDSRSSGPSDDKSDWPEQTYGPAGGLCADGNNNTNTRSSAGPCYGGRRGNTSDKLSELQSPSGSALSAAEHLARIKLSGSDVQHVDFGFSYNVVTTTRDGDDEPNSALTIQGSLRQFIQNANFAAVPNKMRFVPAVPLNQGNWWQITLGSILPNITGDQTTIDGTAYDLADGVTVRNTNPGSAGSGGTVGIDGLSLARFARKELEINQNNLGGQSIDINAPGNTITLRNIAMYNSGAPLLSITNAGTVIISQNYFGPRADGSNPGSSFRANAGISFGGSAAISGTVQSNYIAFLVSNGIGSRNGSVDVAMNGNELFNCALIRSEGDGMDILGSWQIEQNLFHANGNASSEPERGGAGIELGRNVSNAITAEIINNTLRNNVTTGINILDNVINTTIKKNVISGNGTSYAFAPDKLGAGVKVTFPDANKNIESINISQNSMYGNHGLGIDLVTTYGDGRADGVTPNDGATTGPGTEPNTGMDYPVFTKVTLDGTILHVEGFVGTSLSKITGTQTIELFKAADDGNNSGEIIAGDGQNVPHGEGKTYLGSFTTNSNGTFTAEFAVANLSIGEPITATSTDPNNNTSEFSANYRVEKPGVAVGGTVYDDVNHNGINESGEEGISGVTIVLHKLNSNTCRSVSTDANGEYQFGSVKNGDYKIIESANESAPIPQNCPPTQNDPEEYVSTTSNVIPISITGADVPARNFGDFHGSSLSGTVFKDNGSPNGTANDGVQNGDEEGLAEIFVNLMNADGNTMYAQTKTKGDGSFKVWIPHDLNGNVLKLYEKKNNNFISTGANLGNTEGDYNRTTDIITFTPASGKQYSGIAFAGVNSSSLLTDGQQNLLPGTSATFQHQFIAHTAGEVSFKTQTTNNPRDLKFPVQLYRDENKNSRIDTGESRLQPADKISVQRGDQLFLIMKVNVSPSAPARASSTITLKALFDLQNSNPRITQTLNRTDLVNVTEQNGGLSLRKSVDKAQALPGEILTYTIMYVNNGSDPIQDLKINDATPSYTTFKSAGCGTLPDEVSNCFVTKPSSGSSGSIIWDFNGSLAPGSSGQVYFKVLIQQ